MTQQDVYLDGVKQAFEDFIAHEAELAIAEATRDRDAHKRLWVVLYGDGRYGLEHRSEAEPAPVIAHEPIQLPQIAFPIEPLTDAERDLAHLEDSRFDRPIDALWASFQQALRTHFDRQMLSPGATLR